MFKEQGANYDIYLSNLLYRVNERPEEIFARLMQGTERELLRYDYDHRSREIKLYWQGTMHGSKTTYAVEIFEHAEGTMLRLRRVSPPDKKYGFGGLQERTKQLERLNLFLRRIAGAQPIPYNQIKS